MYFPCQHSAGKITRLAAALPLAIVLGGCVGSQQLRTSNQKLSATASSAKVYTENLKAAVNAQDDALATARASVADLTTTTAQLAREKAIGAVDAAYYKAVVDLHQAHAGLLTEWLDTTQSTFADFDESLKSAFGPIEQARRHALSRYQEAKKLSAEFPNDSARRGNMEKQLAAYLSVSAVAFQQEDQARASATDAWQAIDKDFRTKIDASLAVKKVELDKVHSDALGRIAAISQANVQVPADVPKLAEKLEPLVDFCDGAQKTADANVQYFQVYGFGKGSLFGSFVQNLGTGLTNSLPIVGSGKTVTAAELTAAVNQVADDQKAAIATAGSNASATLKQAGESLIQQVTTAFTNKLQATAAKMSQTASTTSSPAEAAVPNP